MDNLLYDLFRAYYSARKNKRNTINALSFEINHEEKIFRLYREIKSRKYKISPSLCFISFRPVKREIFASDFRDRVVHHLIYNYINPVFEKVFINDTYSCRTGKGTSCGIERAEHFIRSCSKNYSKDCHILKLDIKGYFMAMDRSLLYKKVKETLKNFKEKTDFDLDLVLYLVYKTIFNDPVKNCKVKGKITDWKGLPKSKTLFWTKRGKGLPIGNLTSQLFGNVYLNEFDHFIKEELKIKCYGRYVDDIIIIHKDKEYLKILVSLLKRHLKQNFFLELHSKKIYLQHFSKGVLFLGAIIKPYRSYIGRRTKGNFYRKIGYWKDFFENNKGKMSKKNKSDFLASVNSYLGAIKRKNTYKLRKKIVVEYLLPFFEKYILSSGDYGKVVLKT